MSPVVVVVVVVVFLLLYHYITPLGNVVDVFFAAFTCCENISWSNSITQSRDLAVSVKAITLNHIILPLLFTVIALNC